MAELEKPQDVIEVEPQTPALNVWKIVVVLFVVIVLGITFLALIGPAIGNVYSYTGGSL